MGEFTEGVTWFPDKEIEIGGFAYRLSGPWGETFVSRREAVRYMRFLDERPHLRERISVTRVWVTETVPACSWCGARPKRVEWDCDGAYYTSCDSPQCR